VLLRNTVSPRADENPLPVKFLEPTDVQVGVNRLGALLTVLPLVTLASTASAEPFTVTRALQSNGRADSGADTRPSVAMDTTGRVLVVWTSTDTLGGTIGSDADVLVSRSTDYGLTWSPVAPLAAYMATDVGADRSPSITAGANGTYVVVWATTGGPGGALGGDGDVVFVRSTDGGQSWSAPAPIDPAMSADAAVDLTPRVATDGQGNWIVTYSTRVGDSDAVDVRSTDDGATWSAPQPLAARFATDTREDLRPVPFAGLPGTWVIAWESNQPLSGTRSDFDLHFVRSVDGGLTWTTPALLNNNGGYDSGDDRAVDLASDGAGNWVAAWHSSEPNPWGPDMDILSVRSVNDGTTWTTPREIYAFALIELGQEWDPRVVSDRMGTFVVTWWREDSIPGGAASDVDVLQATSYSNGANWVGPELINNVALVDVGNDYAPAIATNGVGGLVVVWHTTDSAVGASPADTDIVVATQVCGDGVSNAREQCDDGNLVAGDCCSPTCTLAPPLTICRAAVSACDAAEVCDGVSALCPSDVFAPAGTTCRDATSACDPADVCTGLVATCPVDVPAPAGTPCRGIGGACDVAEVCDGASLACPSDLFVGAGQSCRASAGVCDVAEACDGASAACPADARVAAGIVCRVSAGVCDLDELCDGAAVDCPADARAPAATVCRAAVGVCDAEERCGGGVDCPPDGSRPDGSACVDGLTCNGSEQCVGGVCAAGVPLLCDDGDVCTAESCTEPGGCSSAPIANCCRSDLECDDGNACTRGTCSGPGGTCTQLAVPGCCLVDADCADADACTADACVANRCQRTPITGCCATDADCGAAAACTAVACSATTRRCEVTPIVGCCASDADCNDGNACTNDACDLASGRCENSARPGCCSTAGDCADGDRCTVDTCAAPGASCGHARVAGCCNVDADCGDGNACTSDRCNPATARCESAPIEGCCTADADCGAPNACSVGRCDLAAGRCALEAVPGCCAANAECDDRDACTTDRCNNGTCAWTAIPACGAADGGVADVGSDAGVTGPDGAVVAPDATVEVPDGAVVTPDATVAPDGGPQGDGAVVEAPDAAADAGRDGAVDDAGDGAADAGPAPGTDASVAPGSDAGRTSQGLVYDDDGCQCSDGRGGRSSTAWALLVVVGLALRRRRR
jgi:cysteine-rich repeat protein